jgi:hypothetical protein
MGQEIGGSKIPSAREMAQLSAITAGKSVDRYPLYSILDMEAAGNTQLQFFATAQGGTQIIGALSLNMTRARTNIQKANALATPNDYILKAIRLFVFPRYAEATPFTKDFLLDMYLLLCSGNGYLRIVFGQREHLLISPLVAISAGAGLEGVGSTNNTTDVISYMANSHPLLFKVEPWVVIPSELNFNIELNYDTAPNISAKAKIGVWLDGDIVRPVS